MCYDEYWGDLNPFWDEEDEVEVPCKENVLEIGDFIILPGGKEIEATFKQSKQDRLMGRGVAENPDIPFGERKAW